MISDDNNYNLQPCPCCGKLESLSVGANDADSECVECMDCGLKMIKYMYDWPEDFEFSENPNSDLAIKENLDKLRKTCRMEAVKSWNKRFCSK